MASKVAARNKKAQDDRPPLPKQPQVRDRVRLREDRIFAYKQACEAAGYEFDPQAIRTVTRVDDFGPGGQRRLWVDGAPHMFGAADVELAWSDDEQRRRALEALR